ncbi:MAG: peptidase S41, partial [Kibdelosporangium sp.]
MSNAYLRFPHLNGDLVTFVAEDDVWLAPLDGGRAWRVSADQVPVAKPRISPDGRHVAWTSTRDVEPEVHVAPIDGGPSRRLTYWGAVRTSAVGWTPDGEVLAVSSVGQAQFRRTWGYEVPLEGIARKLPYGPIGDIAHGPDGAVLLGSRISVEPAWWKRYRGGTAGR